LALSEPPAKLTIAQSVYGPSVNNVSTVTAARFGKKVRKMCTARFVPKEHDAPAMPQGRDLTAKA
jgi:hypothetical protein